jgi:hypothetical protein
MGSDVRFALKSGQCKTHLIDSAHPSAFGLSYFRIPNAAITD